MNLENITIKEYLDRNGIKYHEAADELVGHCLFSNCDKDSIGNEAHLYFSVATGQYDCKKCGAKGNILTLAKHLGDIPEKRVPVPRNPTFNEGLIGKCHAELPLRIREYLNNRGVSNEFIGKYRIGFGRFYGKHWITIPIKDQDGNYSFFKLRQDPSAGDEKITFPKGEAQLYDWEVLDRPQETLFICEGELDRLLLVSLGVSAITSTHGAGTFKESWLEKMGKSRKTYICYDNDDAGRKGSERVAKLLENLGTTEVYIVTLPDEVGEHGDITDYFIKLSGTVEDLFGKYAKRYPEPIDISQFQPMGSEKLAETLELTIKHDQENKIAAFLCELAAYTEDAQFNISFNAPSSTGKSFIPTEIARLFPEDDVVELAYCSPTAFFHDHGEYDKEKRGYTVDLSRKIIIFLDQPHTGLLAHLRPLLSHDKKEIVIKITDKSQKHGMRTKNILLRGYPSVIFCTAGLEIDEQEATRFLLLSPEVSQDKILHGITAAIRKDADKAKFNEWLNENPERGLLKDRILAIRAEHVRDINIGDAVKVGERFLATNKILKPRHQRDIKRLMAIIKSFALLNMWWRERSGSTVIANKDDIEEAFRIWEKISISQELNLPPYIYNLFNEVILPAWNEKNNRETVRVGAVPAQGITRQEILDKHYRVYGRMLAGQQLRQQILPMLETAGLIIEEGDPNDKRKRLVYPSNAIIGVPEKNSVPGGGVSRTDNAQNDPAEKASGEF